MNYETLIKGSKLWICTIL